MLWWYDDHASAIKRMEQAIHELQVVSGRSIHELIDLFAKGYELAPPSKPISMKGLAEEE